MSDPTRELFAGIDGGQSSTVAVIGDGMGRVLARVKGGPTDDVGQGPGSRRRADTIETLLGEGLAAAGYPTDSRFAAVVAGISGYEGPDDAAPAKVNADHFRLAHDAPVAHAGAFGGAGGIIAIAGTGSVVYAASGEQALTLGGWGYVFGDEGSSFWLAREALAAAMRASDRGESTPLGEAALPFFEVPDLRALARAFASGSISRARLAGFATLVANAAQLGERNAAALLDSGADALARLTACAARTLAMSEPRIAAVGGLFSRPSERERFAAAVASHCPGAVVRDALYEPAVGALLLAYRDANQAVDAPDLSQLGVAR